MLPMHRPAYRDPSPDPNRAPDHTCRRPRHRPRHRPRAAGRIGTALGVGIALLLGLALPRHPARGEEVRTFEAFGDRVAITVDRLDPARARAAIAAAEEEIREIERLTPPREPGRHRVDRRLALLLERAKSFCRWSEGAHGPLGGRLYALWGVRGGTAAERERRGLPSPTQRAAAAESARCDRLAVDGSAGTVELLEGSVIDVYPFAAGFAVDRAIDALGAAGAGNALVQVGPVVRGVGPGPEGRGWPIELPAFPGLEGPPQRYRLRDQALAIAAADATPLIIGGDRLAPFIDQRSGRPADGVVATVIATELAIDAQALATAAFVLGTREGAYRLGQLQPVPAVQWLLGSGSGKPLISSFHWSQLASD